MNWIEQKDGAWSDPPLGTYAICRLHPRDKRYGVKFRGVAISSQKHTDLVAAKAEAEAHYNRATGHC